MFSTLLTFLLRTDARSEAVERLRLMSDRELSDLGIGRGQIRDYVEGKVPLGV